MPLIAPDADQIGQWLRQFEITHYICDQCHGLHLSALQGRDGVLDSRLFMEAEGLLFSTELEIRPAALFAVQAEMSRLNMTWPALKLFIEVTDDAMPRLIVCDLLLTEVGVAPEQFRYFVESAMAATAEVIEECQRAGWLGWPMEADADDLDGSGGHLH